jgi:hypothetical protein
MGAHGWDLRVSDVKRSPAVRATRSGCASFRSIAQCHTAFISIPALAIYADQNPARCGESLGEFHLVRLNLFLPVEGILRAGAAGTTDRQGSRGRPDDPKALCSLYEQPG